MMTSRKSLRSILSRIFYLILVGILVLASISIFAGEWANRSSAIPTLESTNTPEEAVILPSLTQTPLPSPFTSAQLVSSTPTVQPTSIPTSPSTLTPTPTSFTTARVATPVASTTAITSEFQITEAQAETNTSGKAQLNLSVTLDKLAIQSPVQELVYVTIDSLNGSTSESISTIWRISVQDISQVQPVLTLTHRREAFPDGLTLSPDNKYLVYGQEYNKRTGLMEVQLLDLDTNTFTVIDKDVTRQANSYTFLWAPDSQSIIYTKVSDDWEASAVYQYSIETGQSQPIIEMDALINLVGWSTEGIYYIPLFTSSQVLTLFNIDTGQTQEILILPEIKSNYIRMSPNALLALFDSIIINVQEKTQVTISPFDRPLWFPDSQGLLGIIPGPTQSFAKLDFNRQQPETELPLNISLPTTSVKLVSWSPDGRYLIYRNLQTDSYHLLDTTSGREQRFESTSVLRVGGWISQ